MTPTRNSATKQTRLGARLRLLTPHSHPGIDTAIARRRRLNSVQRWCTVCNQRIAHGSSMEIEAKHDRCIDRIQSADRLRVNCRPSIEDSNPR